MMTLPRSSEIEVSDSVLNHCLTSISGASAPIQTCAAEAGARPKMSNAVAKSRMEISSWEERLDVRWIHENAMQKLARTCQRSIWTDRRGSQPIDLFTREVLQLQIL